MCALLAGWLATIKFVLVIIMWVILFDFVFDCIATHGPQLTVDCEYAPTQLSNAPGPIAEGTCL